MMCPGGFGIPLPPIVVNGMAVTLTIDYSIRAISPKYANPNDYELQTI